MVYALKLTGAGTERVAAALLALSRDQQKTRGKTTLNTLLRSEKELTVFTVPQDRLRDFAREAKRYGVLYCVLKEKKGSQSNDPFWDTAAQMLLMALVLYVVHEAPPEEQNFPMVMELLAAGEVKENDDNYQSPLASLLEEATEKVQAATQQLAACQEEYNNLLESSAALEQEYDQILSWADLYDTCSISKKKMIISQLVNAIHVRRDYDITVEFNISFEDFQTLGYSEKAAP